MNRRKFLKTLFVGAASVAGTKAVSFTGASETFAASSVAKAQEKQPIQIMVMTTPEERALMSQKMGTFVQKFHEEKEEHRNCQIDTVFIPWSAARDKIQTIFQSPTSCPHILQVGTTWMGWILDIGKDYIQPIKLTEEENKNYTQGILDSCRASDGTYYAKPWFVDLRTIFINKTLVDPILQEPPFNKRFPSTWEDFDVLCRRLQEKRYVPFVFSGHQEWNLIHNSAGFIWSAGGRIASESEILIGEPKSVQGLCFLGSLIATYSPKPEQLPQDREELENRFLQGEYAMIIGGYWMRTRAKRYENLAGYLASDEVGMVMLPAKNVAPKRIFLGGSNLVLLKKNDIAYDFLNFLSRRDNATEYAATVGAISAFGDVPDETDLPVLKSLIAQGRTYPIRPDWARKEFKLSRTIAEVIQYVSGVYGEPIAPVWKENSPLNPIISAILKKGSK